MEGVIIFLGVLRVQEHSRCRFISVKFSVSREAVYDNRSTPRSSIASMVS
jgi:hypothetical protein